MPQEECDHGWRGNSGEGRSVRPLSAGESRSECSVCVDYDQRWLLLALALFDHVVAGLGEDEPAAQSWFEVEPFLLAHALRLTGESKMGAAAGPLQ